MAEGDDQGETDVLRLRLAAAERELEGLRRILDLAPLAVSARDASGRILMVNQAMAAAFGSTPEQLVGKQQSDLFRDEAQLEQFRTIDREVLASGESVVVPELPFQLPDGSIAHLQLTNVRIEIDTRPAVLTMAVNMTEQYETMEVQKRMLETQRLESLGLLAGGIAHDYNNLLMGVIGHAELAASELPDGSPAHERLAELRDAASQLAGLTRQVLAYSGKGKLSTGRVALSDVVRQTAKLVAPTLPSGVALVVDPSSDAVAVDADRGQMQQIVVNLITNAVDAVAPRGGRVEIGTFAREQPDGVRSVELRVRDDGPGIDADSRQRIFEPYFSSKGSGRGLGLAAVAGIVRGHQARLELDCEPGEGTTFRIYFSPAEGPVTVEEAASVVGIASPRAILLVDDEPVVRRSVRAMLEYSGYRVYSAADGASAMELVRDGAAFDAAVLDMTMPGMSTAALHTGLRRHRPGLPVILSSGYHEGEAIASLLERPNTTFLQKPFSTRELVQQLQLAWQADGSDNDDAP